MPEHIMNIGIMPQEQYRQRTNTARYGNAQTTQT